MTRHSVIDYEPKTNEDLEVVAIPSTLSVWRHLSPVLAIHAAVKLRSSWPSSMPHSMISTRLFLLLTISLLFPSGCMKIGPDFARPPAAVSKNWLDADDCHVKTDSATYRNWWEVFGDPALNKLIETAYRQNLSLKIAGVRVLEARAQLGIAVGEFYPQTQQALGYLEKNYTSQRNPQAAFNPNLEYFLSEIAVQTSWELDFWGKFRRTIESADASLLATIADYDETLVTLTADVANLYVIARTLGRRLDVAGQNVVSQSESLELATKKFKSGTTSQRDVEQAKTLLKNTEAFIPTLQTQLRQTKNALSILLGIPPSHLADLLGNSSEIPSPPLQAAVGIPADLLRRRPDIRSAELKAAAQCAKIGIAKADLLPAFTISGKLGFQSSDVSNFTLGDMFGWKSHTAVFGPSFQWNILNYGQISNQIRLQDARFQELLITYQNAVLKAQQQVEDSLTAFLQTQARAQALAESTAAAKSSLDLALLQYQGGITDFTTVLTAQQALLNEQDSLSTTLGEISQSLIEVYRAMGGGWQIREGNDFVSEAVKLEMAQRTNWGELLSPAAYKTTGGPEGFIRKPDW